MHSRALQFSPRLPPVCNRQGRLRCAFAAARRASTLRCRRWKLLQRSSPASGATSCSAKPKQERGQRDGRSSAWTRCGPETTGRIIGDTDGGAGLHHRALVFCFSSTSRSAALCLARRTPSRCCRAAFLAQAQTNALIHSWPRARENEHTRLSRARTIVIRKFSRVRFRLVAFVSGIREAHMGCEPRCGHPRALICSTGAIRNAWHRRLESFAQQGRCTPWYR